MTDRDKVLTVRVPPEIHDGVKVLAVATDRSANQIVLLALRDYLSTKGHRETVLGFAKQAEKRYKVALDKLADL